MNPVSQLGRKEAALVIVDVQDALIEIGLGDWVKIDKKKGR